MKQKKAIKVTTKQRNMFAAFNDYYTEFWFDLVDMYKDTFTEDEILENWQDDSLDLRIDVQNKFDVKVLAKIMDWYKTNYDIVFPWNWVIDQLRKRDKLKI